MDVLKIKPQEASCRAQGCRTWPGAKSATQESWSVYSQGDQAAQSDKGAEAEPLLIGFIKAVWRGILAWKSTCSAAFSKVGKLPGPRGPNAPF